MISTLEAQRPAMVREMLIEQAYAAEEMGWTDAVVVASGPEGMRLVHTAANVTRRGTTQERLRTAWLLLAMAIRVLLMRGGER